MEIRLISGNLLAEVRNNKSSLPDEVWYTGQLRCQIAMIMGIEPGRVTLVDAKGDTVSDETCVIEGPLTAIAGQPEEQPFVYEGVAALRV